ncbi:mCG146195, partial [Mus musculus]
ITDVRLDFKKYHHHYHHRHRHHHLCGGVLIFCLHICLSTTSVS